MDLKLKLSSGDVFTQQFDMYCPKCGYNGLLFRHEGHEDYYEGAIYFCLNCESKHRLDACNDKIYDCDILYQTLKKEYV